MNVEDYDKAVIIPNLLPKSYDIIVDAMEYARETLSFEDV